MINTLRIQFDVPISFQEIQCLRGAIIASGKEHESLLLHNHKDDDNLRYSYPLVQYKRVNGKAFILCFEEGARSMMQVLPHLPENVQLGQRQVSIKDFSIQCSEEGVAYVDSPICYSLQNWIPLNDENFRRYKHMPALMDRVEMLQDILTGNILSFAKGLGLYCNDPVLVSITDMDKPVLRRAKGVDFLCFNIEFLCNLSLPQYIGLGKSSSKGYGVVKRINHYK